MARIELESVQKKPALEIDEATATLADLATAAMLDTYRQRSEATLWIATEDREGLREVRELPAYRERDLLPIAMGKVRGWLPQRFAAVKFGKVTATDGADIPMVFLWWERPEDQNVGVYGRTLRAVDTNWQLGPRWFARTQPIDSWRKPKPKDAPYFWFEIERIYKETGRFNYMKPSPEGPLHTCPDCGKRMEWFYFRSGGMTWQMLCGRAGWIQVCFDCREWTPILDGKIIS